jgi:acyl-ACP thioesterase
MNLIHTSTYRLRSYEVDFEDRAFLTALCNMLQDAASMHAAELGFGYGDLHRLGRAWVLSRAFIHMDALPGFGTDVEVETWPSGNQKTVATRDFLLKNGDVIGRGTSAWAVIDIEDRKAVSPESLIADRDIPQVPRALEFESRAVKRIRDGEHATTVRARYGDHDINGHVNSMRSVEYCLEAVPESWRRERVCVGGDVQFRAECFAGDELRSIASPQEDGTMLHTLIRQSDQRETARMKTWWEPR